MTYRIKAKSRKGQKVKMGIALLLMSLGFINGTMNTYYILIYGLGIISFINKMIHKDEII